jgi:hypothetical protein
VAKNVGNAERAIRVTAGLFIISLAFWGPQSNWAFLGALPIITGLAGWCPLYSLLGVSTCKKSG